LSALHVPDLVGTDLSAVTTAGTVLRGLRWLPIPVPDPAEGETIRDQVDALRIQKCEGTWSDRTGIWFVASYGGGPDAEDEEDRSAARHGGQIWRYRPDHQDLELVVTFDPASDYEGPDNITVAPYGDAVMCTDGDDDRQFVAGITPRGSTYPIARNRMSDEEFAGACFSPDGRTLFVNVQEPGTTFAIWGPWPR
jgi:secreted PhoX family phosphatase